MSWPMVKLESISEFIRNGASIKQDKAASGLPITRIETIAERKVNLEKCGYADIKDNEYKDYRLLAGDILISHINSEKHLGKCAIFEEDRTDVIHGMNLLCLRPIKEKISPRYLFHILSSPAFLNLISSITKKSVNQASFTVTAFKLLEIPLPPLAEQKRIAAILDKAVGICQKREQAIKLADDFLRSTFLEIFGDPISNSKSWELKKLGDIADCQLGKMLSQKSKNGLSPKKYLRNANIRWRKIDIHDLLEMDFNETEKSKFELRKGDLLVCEGGEIGRCAIWNNQIADCYYQKALHRVRPNYRMVTSVYLQEYLYSMAKNNAFSEFVSEVTFSHLTAEKLKNLLVPVPPLSLQEKFELIYKKFNELLNDKYNNDELSFILLSNSINDNMFKQSLFKDKH